MKKHLSILLTAAVITMLFTGCGGSSTAASSGAAPEAGKTETAEASVQGDESAEKTSPQKAESTESASAQDKVKTGAPTGFQHLSQTVYNSEGVILNKYTYYEDRSFACLIMNSDLGVKDLKDVGSNYNSNFPQGFLMKSLINSDFVSIIMLTYTGLDKTYDLAHYTKRAPAFGIIRSTKIHSYTERSARSYDNPKCKK